MHQTEQAAVKNPKGGNREKQILKLAADFGYFVYALWQIDPSQDLPPNCTPHAVQYDICKWLQKGPNRRIVRGFRGLSKSWLTVAYALWRLLRNPNEKVMLCSETEGFAKKLLHMLRFWIDEVWFLNHLAPQRHNDHYRDNRLAFDVGCCKPSKDPSVSAVGVTGALPGIRASIVVPDDVETPENSRTRDGRQLLRERVLEFENLLLPQGDIVYLGTPHHEETLYDYLVDEMGYACRTWPLEYPAADQVVPNLSPMLQDHIDQGQVNMRAETRSVWPERWGHDEIVRLRISKRNYAMQFMMRSDLADLERYPLRLEDFIVHPCHRDLAPVSIVWGLRTNEGPTTVQSIPSVGFTGDNFHSPIFVDKDMIPYRSTKAALDPAGRGKDEMAWAIMSQLHGNIFWKYVNGVHGGATQDNLETIVLSLRQYNATELFIESNFGGEFLIPLIQTVVQRFSIAPGENDALPDGWSCNVQGLHASGQKEIRTISAFEAPLAQHRIVIDPSVAKDEVTMFQLTRLTHDRNSLDHEDRIEAAAMTLAQFKDVLNQDAPSLAKQHHENAAFLDMLKRHSGFSINPRFHQHHWNPIPIGKG